MNPQALRLFLGAVACAALLLTACGQTPTSTPTASQSTDPVRESKEIAQQFMGTLKGELSQAIAESGLPGAIEVCKEVSLEMEQRFTREHEAIAQLRRVSTQPRNVETHTPTPAERDWLQAAAQAHAAGETVQPGQLQHDGQTTVMLPIVINNSLCLGCHGDSQMMSTELKQALQTHYPEDQATGYAMGDFRGALAVTWNE